MPPQYNSAAWDRQPMNAQLSREASALLLTSTAGALQRWKRHDSALRRAPSARTTPADALRAASASSSPNVLQLRLQAVPSPVAAMLGAEGLENKHP